jgi:hypothetical protein
MDISVDSLYHDLGTGTIIWQGKRKSQSAANYEHEENNPIRLPERERPG